MVCCGCQVRTWKFIGKQMSLMDQRRQALRANVHRLAFEGQLQQRNDFIRAFAIQAYFFVFCVHGFSNNISVLSGAARSCAV
jgi:hypothetical protein